MHGVLLKAMGKQAAAVLEDPTGPGPHRCPDFRSTPPSPVAPLPCALSLLSGGRSIIEFWKCSLSNSIVGEEEEEEEVTGCPFWLQRSLQNRNRLNVH